jgi:hypothetical protein
MATKEWIEHWNDHPAVTRLLSHTGVVWFLLMSTSVTGHSSAPRIPINWDDKYIVCDNTTDCFYSYCDPEKNLTTVCLYDTVMAYLNAFGSPGQDCVSFRLLEDFVLDGDITPQSVVDDMCTTSLHNRVPRKVHREHGK